MSEKVYQDVKCYAVSFYVSASVIIKGSHDLQPLQSYLPFSQNYETTRMLILGSTEQLTPDVIQLLEKNDQFLLEIRQLLQDDDLQKCREKIEQRLEDTNNDVPADIMLTLLQLYIESKDLKSYYKYRATEKIETFAGDFLTAMDACAYELEGDIEKANILFSGIAQTCTDYHVLENVHLLKEENRTAAIALSEIVMRNTIQVWRRGTYYRETLKKMPNDGMMRTRVLSILKYVGSIIAGMKQIWITMPKQISNLCDELQKTIADELA